MNLKQAMEVAALGGPEMGKPQQRLSAKQIARKVFKMAAAAGHPFTGFTSDQWAKKWLDSKEFVLMEIESTKVALPLAPKNKSLVLEKVAAAAVEPIVVDTNKCGIGASYKGYVPSVIVIDGKHRYAAGQLRGDVRCMAWVGVKALEKVQPKKVEIPKINDKGLPARPLTKIEAAVAITSPPPAGSMQRQDRESGFSAPHQKTSSVQDYKMYGIGGPGASLGSGSGSNPTRMGFGAVEQEPSDEENDPSDQAPGAGGGKRLAPSKGASNSSLSTGIKAKDYVGTLRTKKPSVKAGGPGSGRHKEFGQFDKGTSQGPAIHYSSPKGNHVAVTSHYPGYPGKMVVTHNGVIQHVGDGKSASDFISQRYGIGGQ